MKPLRKLRAEYASHDIETLVDYVKDAPIALPATDAYRFEKKGNEVHIYGIEQGIKDYQITDATTLGRITSTRQGVELRILDGSDISKIVLHSKPYRTTASRITTRTTSSRRTASGGESRKATSGESRTAARVRRANRSGPIGESRSGFSRGE